ncbi:MAG TPA: AAA family ATPase, partial [Puia sp.]|nr:AAA family ATPase [Puia sp.]
MAIDTHNPEFQLAAQFVHQTSRSLFLTGRAGTGKTTFLRHIRDTGRKKMAVLAPTGVAAINA